MDITYLQKILQSLFFFKLYCKTIKALILCFYHSKFSGHHMIHFYIQYCKYTVAFYTKQNQKPFMVNFFNKYEKQYKQTKTKYHLT